MKTKLNFKFNHLLGWSLLLSTILMPQGNLMAAKDTEFKAPVVSANFDMKKLLQNAQETNNHIFVSLKNGQSYSAYVKEVSGHAVVLKNPHQKEFYEVFVPLTEIASLEIRVKK